MSEVGQTCDLDYTSFRKSVKDSSDLAAVCTRTTAKINDIVVAVAIGQHIHHRAHFIRTAFRANRRVQAAPTELGFAWADRPPAIVLFNQCDAIPQEVKSSLQTRGRDEL